MLPILLFLAGGFFWPALPWGAAAAAALQAVGMISTRQRYIPWLQRSPTLLVRIVLTQLLFAVILHTLLMLPGNLIMGIPILSW